MKLKTKERRLESPQKSGFANTLKYIRKYWILYLFVLPTILWFILFRYLPMPGVYMAFTRYKGIGNIFDAKFVGLQWFKSFFSSAYARQTLGNTMRLSLYELALFPLPIILAMIINEIRSEKFKKVTQTVIYAPTSKNDFSQMSQQELVAFLDRYFGAVLAMLEHSQPDVLAHLTYPLRYINGKFGRNFDWRILEPKIRKILEIIIQKGIALEVNTSCLGTAYDALLPHEEILQMYLQMGGYLLTLGSDAHKPENVGKGFTQTIQQLKGLGIKELYYLKKRKFYAYPI